MKLYQLYEERFNSAVAIVYDDNANILLGKATHDDDRNGKWCFPGGGIKPGECPGEAAARECWEETGFTADPQQMAFQHEPKPGIGFVVLRKSGGCANPNGEFTDLKWVPWNKILEVEDLYPDTAEVLKKPIASFP